VKVGGRYKHFKGNEYVVVSIARDSSTCSLVVVYQGQYISKDFGENPVWVRSLEEFTSNKVFEDGRRVRRFELVE
tara:strand:- start:216 stop:440 length:225 start_codon:yes stop_codon:yes gene_type:complete